MAGVAVGTLCGTLTTHSMCLQQAEHPSLLEHFGQFEQRAQGKRVTLFLDYDGEHGLPDLVVHTAPVRDGAAFGSAVAIFVL